MVEHSVHTRSVICSSQIAATRPVGQAVKTPPFHGGNMGSIPVRVTKKETIHSDGFFFVIRMLNRTHRVRPSDASVRKHGDGVQRHRFCRTGKTSIETARSRRSRRSIPVQLLATPKEMRSGTEAASPPEYRLVIPHRQNKHRDGTEPARQAEYCSTIPDAKTATAEPHRRTAPDMNNYTNLLQIFQM